jgi:hypothetical protein
LPVIGAIDTDFVFEHYVKSIILKESKEKGMDPDAVEKKYFGAKMDSKSWPERVKEIGNITC